MADKNLDGNGLSEVWVRAAQLVKRFTGAVNLTKGDLQTQVDTKITGTAISSSSAITNEGQYALDAREKNASVEGTLANQISNLNSNFEYIDITDQCDWGDTSVLAIGNETWIKYNPKTNHLIGFMYVDSESTNQSTLCTLPEIVKPTSKRTACGICNRRIINGGETTIVMTALSGRRIVSSHSAANSSVAGNRLYTIDLYI